MHRRDFFQWSAAALAAGYAIVPAEVAAALQSGSKSGKNPEGAAKPGIVGGPPVLQSPASDGVTVFQGVRGISTAWVEYGLTPRLDQRADTMRHGLLPLNGLVHRVRLEGLKPGTVYHYRVGVCPIDFRGAYKITRHPVEYTPIHTFRTLQPQDGRAGFFVINDTHENMDTLRGVGAQAPGPCRRDGLEETQGQQVLHALRRQLGGAELSARHAPVPQQRRRPGF